MEHPSRCILNGGRDAWAFDALASQLSRALWVDVADTPRAFNYLLSADHLGFLAGEEMFIPLRSMELAADKRHLASAFAASGVPTPKTLVVDSLGTAELVAAEDRSREWCLKFPTGCGASGHRVLIPGISLPSNWPHPLLVQEFVRMDRPEVYRVYAAGGELFGWVARYFPDGARASPWVAHARGAQYRLAGNAPPAATTAARAALESVDLLESFGCVDLIQRPTGEWLVLEVGTDGVFNHVDRDLGLPEFERELQRRLAEAFWSRLGNWRPWGTGSWCPQTPRPMAVDKA